MMRQIKIFYDEHSWKPIGFVTRAFLAEDVEVRSWEALGGIGRFLFHISEWNEDANSRVLDYFATRNLAVMLRHIMSELFCKHAAINYLRRTADRKEAKIKKCTKAAIKNAVAL